MSALDDGLAEVAVAFSSNPQLSRRTSSRRRRLNATSRLLSTFELRGLNQQVIDGRLAEAVGGEFAEDDGPERALRGAAAAGGRHPRTATGRAEVPALGADQPHRRGAWSRPATSQPEASYAAACSAQSR